MYILEIKQDMNRIPIEQMTSHIHISLYVYAIQKLYYWTKLFIATWDCSLLHNHFKYHREFKFPETNCSTSC